MSTLMDPAFNSSCERMQITVMKAAAADVLPAMLCQELPRHMGAGWIHLLCYLQDLLGHWHRR